jgi:hypothetical protein
LTSDQHTPATATLVSGPTMATANSWPGVWASSSVLVTPHLAEEQLGAVLARVLEEVLGGADLDDLAVGHEDHPVGDLAGEAHLVGDDDHRHAGLGQLLHRVEHLVDHLGVERRGRLVEEHHLRLHGERPGDGHPLLLTARELARVLVRLLGDLDPLEQLHAEVLGLGLLGILRTWRGASVTLSSTVRCGKRLN